MDEQSRTFTESIIEMLMLKTNKDYAKLVTKMFEIHDYV